MEQMSRRWLLRRAAQTAAASVAAGVLLHRETRDVAAEEHIPYLSSKQFDVVMDVAGNPNPYALRSQSSYASHTAVDAINWEGGMAVKGKNHGASPAIFGESGSSGNGVRGTSFSGTGVYGSGANGIVGETNWTDYGATYGRHLGTGYGVVGDGSGSGRAGVLGRNSSGFGVRGEGRTGVSGISGATNQSAVYGSHSGAGTGVLGDTVGNGQAGVRGLSPLGAGVKGEGGFGVWGVGKNGVVGESSEVGWAATYGRHLTTGPGVVGDGQGGNDGNAGVLGRNAGGMGVVGQGDWGVLGRGRYGVVGVTTDVFGAGVWGSTSVAGPAVIGDSTGASGIGVLGRNSHGEGVRGDGKTGVHGWGSTGPGVFGESNQYGGQFRGGKAQLRLMPGTAVGKPTTGYHNKGELYLDKNANLWVCQASGTPGTWKQVRLF
jgi:hypothetical protein